MTSGLRLLLCAILFYASADALAQTPAPLPIPSDEEFVQSVRQHATRAQSLVDDEAIFAFLSERDKRVERYRVDLEERVRLSSPPSEREAALKNLLATEFEEFRKQIVSEFRVKRAITNCSYEGLFPPGSTVLAIELEPELKRSRRTEHLAWNTPLKVAWIDIASDGRTPTRVRATIALPDPGLPFDCSWQALRIASSGARDVVKDSPPGQPLLGSQGVTPPVVLTQRNPGYTSAAMRAKIQGDVEVEALVLEDGSVGEVRVTRSLDTTHGLDDEAVAAMKLWRFRPALDRNGRAVPFTLRVALTFRIH